MKSNILALSLLFSAPAFAGNYQLVSVPHSEVDAHMTIGTDATGTPKNLQGLWWMNGNPLADEVVSFAGTQWETITDADGEITGYVGTLPVYDEGVWSWHDSAAGRLLYTVVLKTKLVYVATFNKDFTYGQVKPTFQPIGVLPKIEIPPSMLVNFTMNQVSSEEFSRDSVVLGQPSQYRFRRIVDADGNRLPAFDEFVRLAESANALLPVCLHKTDEQLPTNCAR